MSKYGRVPVCHVFSKLNSVEVGGEMWKKGKSLAVGPRITAFDCYLIILWSVEYDAYKELKASLFSKLILTRSETTYKYQFGNL